MRCFVAIDASEEVKQALARVMSDVKKIGVDASFAKPVQLHCTLVFLGEKSDEQVKKIIGALQLIRFPRFQVAVRGFGFFPSEGFARVFWVGLQSEELIQLQKRIAQALGKVEDKLFSPHITLARIKNKKNLDELLDYARQNKQLFSSEFVVNKFILKKSTLSPHGARYEDVTSFALF